MSSVINIPFPYVKINRNMDIISTNQLFKQEFSITEFSDISFNEIVPDINLELEKQLILINDVAYNVYICTDNDDINLFFVKCQCSSYETLVGILVFDNYTEVQESMEETRHPHLLAVVDKKINEYFTALDGIIRKFEKDRYLFILDQEKLAIMKEQKFSIMDSLNKIEMGNDVPVAISIGIGMNGESLAQSMEYARGAVDLALGRGGNQIVVKEAEDKYQFIGGNGTESTYNSGVRARTKIYALTELILSASNVIIMGHKNPDLDSLGSAAGMFAYVSFLGKPCNIILNEATPAIQVLYNRLMDDNKYKECFVSSEEALKLTKKKTLIIILDVHIASYCECAELLDKKAKLVIIDHHRKSPDAIEGYALTYHESFASSACELVTEMLMYSTREIKLTKTEAEGLLAGITIDTKNFAFKTGRMTFEAAAHLKKQGADTIAVRKLFQNPMENYVVKAEIVKNAKIFNNDMAISTLETPISNPTVLIAQAADELLGIQGIESSYVLYCENNTVYISARSLGGINVQRLMEKLGGGGHQTGAACQIQNTTLADGVTLLLNTINEYLKEEN